MGIINKTAPVQSGKVYGTLNNPEIFVTYTGKDTDTAKTIVDNSTKTISVNATMYIITVSVNGGVISKEDFKRIQQSTATKIAVTGLVGEKEVNVICSASEDRKDTDEYYKFYGPEDASGYAYVVKVYTEETAAETYTYTVEQELIALMKEDFTTEITVGGVEAGTEIKKGDSVADLLQVMLKGKAPTSTWHFSVYTSAEKPTEITQDWNWVILPRAAKLSGWIFHESTAKLNRGYLSFAFDKEVGELNHMYQNGIDFDVLNGFTKTEVIYNNKSYYLYVADDKTVFDNTTYYRIVWLDTKE